MKVLHVINTLETGGAQKLLSEFLPALRDLGVNADVAVFRETGSNFEKNLKWAGVNIVYLGAKSNFSPSIVSRLRKLYGQYDIIHLHLFPTLYHGVLANTGIGKPILYTEHSTFNRRRQKAYLRPLEKAVYGRLSRIIAVSQPTKDQLLKWLGSDFDSSKISAVNNGIRFFSANKAENEKSPVNDKYILMVSRFTEAKDHATLIKAIPEIKDKNLKIALAGEGPTMDEIVSLAQETGVADRCLFLGDRPDIDSLIRHSCFGVQSSHWEGLSTTAVEFMSEEKPVIASDVDGLVQVVENAGLIFPHGNPSSLAACINNLMDDDDLYRATAEKCLARAKEFSIERMASDYKKIYDEILRS